MEIYVDFEATSLNMHFSEIIEGYFYREDGESYYLKIRPQVWSYEAEKIHGISYDQAMTYKDAKTGLLGLLKWLPLKWTMVCYANVNHYYNGASTYCPYDYGVLGSNIMWTLGYDKFNEYRNRVKWRSVHSKAKEVLRLKKYSQEDVARQFDIRYDAHNAKEDVMAMVEIDKKLDRLSIFP